MLCVAVCGGLLLVCCNGLPSVCQLSAGAGSSPRPLGIRCIVQLRLGGGLIPNRRPVDTPHRGGRDTHSPAQPPNKGLFYFRAARLRVVFFYGDLPSAHRQNEPKCGGRGSPPRRDDTYYI